MLFQGVPAWSKQLQVQTDPHPANMPWAGIAIGPGSDEGLVLVDGVPLQAGRIHPIQQARYTVKHIRPILLLDDDGNDQLASIAGLNLILFEQAAELGCEVSRPNQTYYTTKAVQPAVDDFHLALSVPFVGRRQALFFLQSPDIGANAFGGYRVDGVRYCRSTTAIERYPLHEATTVNMSEDGTLAFYIGGTDNAENWDALELSIKGFQLTDPNALATFNVDVDTIGEIGAR